MRTFAANPALGISSTSYMTNLLKGARNLTQRQRLQFIKALKLEGAAAEYFDFLVQFNQAKTLDEKNYFFSHLSRHRGSQAKILLEKQYAFFAKWHHRVIYNYLGLDKAECRARPDRQAPGRKPDRRRSAGVPGTAVGHGPDQEDGQRIRRDRPAPGDRQGVPGRGGQGLPREFLRLAAGGLGSIPPRERRQFNVLAFSVSDKGFAAVKQGSPPFLQEVREIVDRDEDMNQVNVLNIQLFPGARIP